MKSQTITYFNDWLTLMEKAFESLPKNEFRELEEKIINEITIGRDRKEST